MCGHLPDMQKPGTRKKNSHMTDACSYNPTFLHMKALFFKDLKWAGLRAELVFPGEVRGDIG